MSVNPVSGKIDQPMNESGSEARPCYYCGEPTTGLFLEEDRCPTDRGVEVRTVSRYVCEECFPVFQRETELAG